MTANINEIEKRLWSAADELRANSKLKSSEYSVPVLGLIFLRYADYQAIEEVTRDRSRMSLVAANREVYHLLKDGVRIKVNNPEAD